MILGTQGFQLLQLLDQCSVNICVIWNLLYLYLYIFLSSFMFFFFFSLWCFFFPQADPHFASFGPARVCTHTLIVVIASLALSSSEVVKYAHHSYLSTLFTCLCWVLVVACGIFLAWCWIFVMVHSVSSCGLLAPELAGFSSCSTHVFSSSIACGIFVPWPGIEPTSPASQGRILTSGSPRKSLCSSLLLQWLVLLDLTNSRHAYSLIIWNLKEKYPPEAWSVLIDIIRLGIKDKDATHQCYCLTFTV